MSVNEMCRLSPSDCYYLHCVGRTGIMATPSLHLAQMRCDRKRDRGALLNVTERTNRTRGIATWCLRVATGNQKSKDKSMTIIKATSSRLFIAPPRPPCPPHLLCSAPDNHNNAAFTEPAFLMIPISTATKKRSVELSVIS